MGLRSIGEFHTILVRGSGSRLDRKSIGTDAIISENPLKNGCLVVSLMVSAESQTIVHSTGSKNMQMLPTSYESSSPTRMLGSSC